MWVKNPKEEAIKFISNSNIYFIIIFMITALVFYYSDNSVNINTFLNGFIFSFFFVFLFFSSTILEIKQKNILSFFLILVSISIIVQLVDIFGILSMLTGLTIFYLIIFLNKEQIIRYIKGTK